MKSFKNCVWLLCLLIVPAAWATVSVDFDHQAEFSRFQTYSWMAGTPANPIAQKRFEAAVNRELAEKGYEMVDGDADFYVVTHAARSTRTQVDINSYGYYDRYPSRGWGGGMSTGTATVREIPMGTILVDILDAESRELIWRGTATAAISTKAEKNEKKLNKLVGKMFKKFPPEPK
ncbi:MAG: DUF4136 domain-containing protein [Acidobacteriota bacterium]